MRLSSTHLLPRSIEYVLTRSSPTVLARSSHATRSCSTGSLGDSIHQLARVLLARRAGHWHRRSHARAGGRTDLADSALRAGEAEFGGTEFYPGLAEKAAVLVCRLAWNHPLPDGNKRAAWATGACNQ